VNSEATYRLDVSAAARIIAQNGGNVDNWMTRVAEQMVEEVKLSMGTSPPGRTYMYGNVEHVASIAGHPPTPVTGALQASIRWEKDSQREHTVYVGDGVSYGIYLELGTGNMEARPFIGPVFDNWSTGGKLEADARTALNIHG